MRTRLLLAATLLLLLPGCTLDLSTLSLPDGVSWEVNGRCEACSVVLLDSDYRVDHEGIQFCVKCFDELVAAETGVAT